MPHYAVQLLNAFLLCVVLIQLLAHSAARIGLLDLPRGRRVHEGAIPQIGGVAMFAAFAVAALGLDMPLGSRWGLFTGLSLLVAAGVLDDLVDMSPRPKLVLQAVAAMVMVLAGPTVVAPGDLSGGSSVPEPVSSALFTVLLVVGLVNAFNMIDGLDGLAGGMTVTALFWLIVVAWVGGRPEVMVYLLLLLFTVLGFLTFNMRHPWRRRAAVFMGDAGSTMLGAAIAFFIIELAAGGDTATAPLPCLLWLVAVPAFDAIIVAARRLGEGRSPLIGDRQHLHHLLLQAGLPAGLVTAILVAISSVLGGIGVVGWYLDASTSVVLFGLAAVFALHFYCACYGWKQLQAWRRTAGAGTLISIERELHETSVESRAQER